MNQFYLDIGDSSGDGHENHEKYLIRSEADQKTIEEEYKRLRQLFPDANPSKICEEYEDNTVTSEQLKYMGLSKVEGGLTQHWEEDDKFDVGPEDMANIFIDFFNTHSSLRIERVDEDIKTLDISLGYGCFGS